ncbi:MAG: hypothetical protein AAF605_08435 [Myxococcota bacterium]
MKLIVRFALLGAMFFGATACENDDGEGGDASCSTSQECDADPASFGQICIGGGCSECRSDSECQRVEYYGDGASCIDGRCRDGGSSGTCANTVCADRQLCGVVGGQEACLEECESGFRWDAPSSACLADASGNPCAPSPCAERQVCEAQDGAARCLEECEAGFIWDPEAGGCDALADATCEDGGESSIKDQCDSANRECVAQNPGAACEGCLPGFVEDGSDCREALGCSDVECGEGEICSAADGGDARCVAFDPATCSVGPDVCPVGDALNPTTSQCVTCEPCASDSTQTGELYPITSQDGECLCVPRSGYFISKARTNEATPCDADGDGWTRVTAKNSLDDDDCAIAANANCEVRTIDQLVFYSDEDEQVETIALSDYFYAGLFSQGTEFLSLFESDVNDDLSLRSSSGDFEELEPFFSGAGVPNASQTEPLEARDLNSLTKACAPARTGGASSVDYNANGIADVDEWHGMAPNGQGAEDAVEDFTHLSFFIELMEGWYVAPEAPNLHGSYHFRERSRQIPASSALPLPLVPLYDDDDEDFGAACYRKRDRRFVDNPLRDSAPNIGMDFTRLAEGSISERFLGHSSQFKCVSLFDGADTRSEAERRAAPQQVSVDAFQGSDPSLELTACRRQTRQFSTPIDPDPDIPNPTTPPIVCETAATNPGVVAFATVIYDPAAVSGCLDECGEQELLPEAERCRAFGEPGADCRSNTTTGQLTECGLDAGCAFCAEQPDGSFDCDADNAICGVGSGACGQCVVNTDGAIPVATCQANQSACGGNCDRCDEVSAGSRTFACVEVGDMCTGNCATCSGSGNNYSCIAVPTECGADCGECSGGGTQFSCRDIEARCPDEVGEFDDCEYTDGLCDETGTRSRQIKQRECREGACVQIGVITDKDECCRDREGVSCGPTTNCGSYGSCGGYSSTCDESGTQTRTCDGNRCRSGTCRNERVTQSQSCNTDTDGDICDQRGCPGGTQSICCSSGSCNNPCSPCQGGF